MTLAIYTIMRDERANVAQWAETTGDADIRLVVDTGSTDDTVEELKRHGINVAYGSFEPFRFDDARNMALALIPPSVDWCLQVDADETLSANWRDAFESVADPLVPRYRYRWVNHGLATWNVVMRTNLHARRGFRWRYPCHEVLTPSTVTRDVPGMTIEHHPDETKSRGQYLGLLQWAAFDEPTDQRMSFYYGRELFYAGSWDAAREELWRFLAMPKGWEPERSEAYRVLAFIDHEPERWLWRAVGECPDRREPYCDLARLYLRRGDAPSAKACFVLAERHDDETIYTTSRDCWGDAFEVLRTQVSVAV